MQLIAVFAIIRLRITQGSENIQPCLLYLFTGTYKGSSQIESIPGNVWHECPLWCSIHVKVTHFLVYAEPHMSMLTHSHIHHNLHTCWHCSWPPLVKFSAWCLDPFLVFQLWVFPFIFACRECLYYMIMGQINAGSSIWRQIPSNIYWVQVYCIAMCKSNISCTQWNCTEMNWDQAMACTLEPRKSVFHYSFVNL